MSTASFKPRLRRPHRLPGNKSSETPSQCIWVDTETTPTLLDDGVTEAHHLDFGMACYRRRTPAGKWSRPEWFAFTERDSFWDWVISKTRAKTRLYVFAHNGTFDLPVLAAFTQLPDRGWLIHNAIVDAPPIDISWRKDKATIRFIDTLNIWRMPLAALGASVGLRKLKMPDQNASMARHRAYCRRDVKVIMRACLNWFAFLVDNDLGGFKPTLASQAFGAYRHRFMQQDIFIHSNERALAVERDSYVGGRCECFKLGEFQGEFYYIDVNSMYPSVMANNPYPYNNLSCYNNVKPSNLDRWRNGYAVIARVSLDTDQPDYPLVHDKKLIFPVGRFDTTLAGPEFWRAYDAGHVVKVHQAAVYHQAPLFTDFIDFFYSQRMAARSRGDAANTFNYKVISNSLYGKFGQRGRQFKIKEACDPDLVEITESIKYETGVVTTVRCFGGIRQVWVNDGEAFNSFPAIASFVASYARCVLADAIALAGRENCYYCDTDSLIINRVGWERISHLVDQDQLGAWSLDRILERLVLHGPKDYAFDDVWRTKGIRASATWVDDSTVRQDMFVGFRGLVRHGSLDAPLVRQVTKKLRRVYTKGRPTASGEVLPLEIGL